MNRSGWWILPIGFVVMAWQESAENPALFCYRICWSFLTAVRSGEGQLQSFSNPADY